MKTCLQNELLKCVCSICHTRRKAFVHFLFNVIVWTFYICNFIAVANGQTSHRKDDGGRLNLYTPSVPRGLYFKQHPVNSIVKRDDYILLNCSVAITSNLQLTSIKSSLYDIKWFKDDKELKIRGRRTLLREGSLQIGPPLKYGGKTRDDGKYRCSIGYQGYTLLSPEAIVSFAALGKFTTRPVSVNLTVGDYHRFSCSIRSAHPIPKVRWFKDDVEISNGVDLHPQPSHGSPKVAELVMSADRRRVAILPSGILEISRVAMRDAGNYHCVVSNEARSRRSGKAILKVFQGTRKPSKPNVTATPSNTSSTFDTSTVIDCGFSGDPAPRISWKKDGKLINMRHRNKYSFLGKGNLLIKDVKSSDSGMYSCAAKNDFGLSQEYRAFLTVMVAPKFLHVPPQSYHAIVGDSVILRCSAVGWPEPKISWYKNGIKIDNVKNILDLGNVRADDTAMYQCFAENEVGANMSSTLLQVEQGSTYLADIGESAQISVPGVNPVISEPYDVAIMNISSSAVRLSWRPPREGSDAVTHYNVFMEDKDSDLREIRTTECTVIIGNLQRGHQIRIKVVAFCGLISGSSSRPITFIVPSIATVSDGSVENLKASVQSSTEILVSWDPPRTDSDSTRTVTGYKLSMEYVSFSEMKTEEMIIKENFRKYEGLNQHTTYSFRVWVVTEKGIGNPSTEMSATTFEGVPDMPPKNVSVSIFNSSTLRVSWFAPSQLSLNGILQGYKLRYKPFGGKRFTTIEIPPDKNFLDLSVLRRNIEYIIEIQALTRIGGGPFSRRQVTLSPLIVKNEATPPEKPLALITQEFSREIALMWMPPAGSRFVRKYKINWGQNTPYENQRVIDYTQRLFRITDLEPRTSYIIAVQAINNAGPGEESLKKTRTKSLKVEELYPPLGVQARAISHNAINVTWYDKDHNKNTYYEVRYKTNFPSQLETTIANSTEMFLTLLKLKPYKQYDISVRSIHGKRKSSWSMTAVESTFETKPESPPTFFTIMPVFEDTTTVLIRWQPPEKSNGNITGYLIFYSTNANDDISEWVVEPVLGDHSSREVKSLTTDTLYFFKMQARNSKGMGPYSSLIQFQTSKGQTVHEAHKTKITKTPIFYLAIGGVLVLILVVVMVSSVIMFRHYQVLRKNKKSKSEIYDAQVCIGRKRAAAQAVAKPRKTPMNVCELWMRSDYKTRLIANREQVDQHAVFCSCKSGSVKRNDELRTKIIGSRSSSYSRESTFHIAEYDENNDR